MHCRITSYNVCYTKLLRESYSIYNNSEISDPTSYLNENMFKELVNTCVMPDKEFFQIDTIPGIKQVSFTRIGYNRNNFV